jgi:hypothetical protein
MSAENEFSAEARAVWRNRRRHILKWLGGSTAIWVGARYLTATDRDTAHRCRAAMGDRIDRELDDAARHVGHDVLVFLRDVRLIENVDPAESVRAGATKHASGPSLSVLRSLVKDLEAAPADERKRSIAAILFIASIWPDRALVNAVHALARLPGHVLYRMFEDDAALLRTVADNVQKHADLGKAIAETKAETVRLRCELDAATETMRACGAKRGVVYLPTR